VLVIVAERFLIILNFGFVMPLIKYLVSLKIVSLTDHLGSATFVATCCLSRLIQRKVAAFVTTVPESRSGTLQKASTIYPSKELTLKN
jgi:hypothetical protein